MNWKQQFKLKIVRILMYSTMWLGKFAEYGAKTNLGDSFHLPNMYSHLIILNYFMTLSSFFFLYAYFGVLLKSEV